MFGNPDYFKPESKLIPKPRRRSGWAFYVCWLGAIVIPSLCMVGMGKVIEPIAWFLISTIWFSVDTLVTSRNIKRKAELEKLFFIGEEDSHVSTQNYDLNLRNSSSE